MFGAAELAYMEALETTPNASIGVVAWNNGIQLVNTLTFIYY
jgi:hypothetical protein